MNLLILGRGKTGTLVAELAHARRHHVRVLCASENPSASALTPGNLADINAVIDFTAPGAVIANAGDIVLGKVSRMEPRLVIPSAGLRESVSSQEGFGMGLISRSMNLFSRLNTRRLL
jgi:hypothetical protein